MRIRRPDPDERFAWWPTKAVDRSLFPVRTYYVWLEPVRVHRPDGVRCWYEVATG